MPGVSSFVKTQAITWQQFHHDARLLAATLLERGAFQGIIAVTRGGLMPAAILARELDMHLIDTVCVSSYQWQDQEPRVTVLKAVEGDGAGWLLVDDLVDSGRTARIVREMLPKAHFAVLYAKPQGRPLVDTYVRDVDQNTWVLFPWDSEVQYVRPLVGPRERT